MAYEILGKHQLTRTRSTPARAPVLWEILADSRLLPQWVPAVRTVDRCAPGGEAVGAVRHCSVELGGRAGSMVEECVNLVQGRSITYALRDDTFGLAKMFSDYAFCISLEPVGQSTNISVDTYYTPRNALYALMNIAVMRRQFGGVVDRLLSGLCGLAEERTTVAGVDT